MRVSLIDVDSKIPNLALMKISAYHKQKGDIVGLNLSDPEQVYISCIFSKNRGQAIGVSKMFSCPVSIGGYGVNDARLPDYIDHIMPDYSLYNCDYSIGFTTRGCIRKCPFCIVPTKEGNIRVNCDLYEFWNHSHSHVMLLDNNILALPDHFNMIFSQLQNENLTVDFNQGLDIRLINDGNAEQLSNLRVNPTYRFAWDNVKDEQEIRKGISVLKDHGINHSLFYVLVGYNTSKEDDLYRLEVLKSLDQRAYVMRYESVKGVRWYNDLSAWANQQQFFMRYSFDEFIYRRHHRHVIEG